MVYIVRIIFILMVFIPLDLYISLAVLRRYTRNRALMLCYWLPTIAVIAMFAYFIALGGSNFMAHHTKGVGLLAVATMFLLLPKLVFAVVSLSGRLVRLFLKKCRLAAFDIAGAFVAVVCACCIVYGATWGVDRFRVKEVTYASERVPEDFDGYRIVQFSDLHSGSWSGKPDVMSELVGLINAQNPDLIVFTGDIVNQRTCELDEFKNVLAGLEAADGVFSVLGNHDYGMYYTWRSRAEAEANLDSMRAAHAEMGWTLLENSNRIIVRGKDSIALAGVGNDGEPPFPQYADIDAALRGTDGLFTVMLSHNPTHWRREVLPETSADLTLSGHTHGMQMSVFGKSLASLRYPEWSGIYYEGNRALYVNVEIGYIGLPFRFGEWPEITVITLRRSL